MSVLKSRDIDRLDKLPDEAIKIQDAQYLSDHKIEDLFRDILSQLLKEKPEDHIQYIIDSINFGYDKAKQDPKTGLPETRMGMLRELFRYLDKEYKGMVSFENLRSMSSKYGETLSMDELRGIFHDFQPGKDNLISLDEFLVFFSKVSRTMTNDDFKKMVDEMMR